MDAAMPDRLVGVFVSGPIWPGTVETPALGGELLERVILSPIAWMAFTGGPYERPRPPSPTPRRGRAVFSDRNP